MKSRRGVQGLAVALLVTACGGEAAKDADSAQKVVPAPARAGQVTVSIDSPANGATIDAADVRVTLSVTGIEIAPVAEGRAGTAHHHLFLDRDLTPFDAVIPLDDPRVVHMGDGRSEHTFEGLAPGPHRVIAVLADPHHIPLDPPVADTVEFTVGG